MDIIREEIDGITYVYKQLKYTDPDTKKSKLVKRLLHKEYQEETKAGISDVKEQRNGVCVKELRQPSQWYKDKSAARAVVEAERQAEEDEKTAIRKKISDAERQIAIDKLLADGDITDEELQKISEGS